jgi:hypothetical protein
MEFSLVFFATEELHRRKSSGSGLESRQYGRRNLRSDHATEFASIAYVVY